MSYFTDDLMSQLVAESVGTANGNMFISSKVSPPQGGAAQLLIIETGGTGSLRTQNVVGDAYENPSAQILVRGGSYSAVRTMLVNAYNALTKVNNQTLNGTWYTDIRGLQKIIDLGLDENSNVRLAFNVLATKRP